MAATPDGESFQDFLDRQKAWLDRWNKDGGTKDKAASPQPRPVTMYFPNSSKITHKHTKMHQIKSG